MSVYKKLQPEPISDSTYIKNLDADFFKNKPPQEKTAAAMKTLLTASSS